MDTVTAAADYAAQLMREGDLPRFAVVIAARHFGLSAKDVAVACGTRGGTKNGAKRKRQTEEARAFDWLIEAYQAREATRR